MKNSKSSADGQTSKGINCGKHFLLLAVTHLSNLCQIVKKKIFRDTVFVNSCSLP